jgi:hypothetical protein
MTACCGIFLYFVALAGSAAKGKRDALHRVFRKAGK